MQPRAAWARPLYGCALRGTLLNMLQFQCRQAVSLWGNALRNGSCSARSGVLGVYAPRRIASSTWRSTSSTRPRRSTGTARRRSHFRNASTGSPGAVTSNRSSRGPSSIVRYGGPETLRGRRPLFPLSVTTEPLRWLAPEGPLLAGAWPRVLRRLQQPEQHGDSFLCAGQPRRRQSTACGRSARTHRYDQHPSATERCP